MLLILFSLVGVVWIATALKQLKLVTSKGQDVATLLMLTSLAVPKLLALIAPVALLIAAIHVLNRLNSDSETIVLTASGASVWRVARPLLALAMLVALAIAVVNYSLMPWSLRTARQKIVELRTDLISQVLLSGRFSTPLSGITVHIRDRARDGTLLGVLINDNRKPDAHLTYLAEFGQIQRTEKTSFLAMRNGHVFRKPVSGKQPNEPPEILQFETYAVDLDQFERKVGPTRYKPSELYLHELLAEIRKPLEPETSFTSAAAPRDKAQPKRAKRKNRSARKERNKHIAELHTRLSEPLYPFVFVLFAVAFIGRAQSTRTNQTQAMAAGFLAAALARLAGFATENLVTITPAMAPLLYAVPALACLIAAVLVVRANRCAAPSKLALALEDAGAAIAARMPRFPLRQSRSQAGE